MNRCQQCGSDTDTPPLCPVCLEMESRANVSSPVITKGGVVARYKRELRAFVEGEVSSDQQNPT